MAVRMACLRAAVVLLLAVPLAARAQQIDLSHGGPITVTATDSIDLDQKAQTVTAIGNARAVRGDVTVTADRLIADYRKKQPAPGRGFRQSRRNQAGNTRRRHAANAGRPGHRRRTGHRR